MIKAKTEKIGTETMVKGFVLELSPAEMLVVDAALRMFSEAEDRHQDDREWARRLSKEIIESLKDGEEYGKRRKN